jgi:benzoyl-CoA reductase subunit C
MSKLSDIVARAEVLFEDLDFTAARDWKKAEDGRKVIGYMPIYVPRELIHAGGMLPMGVLGGGDQLEVIHGDAYYQSYICRIPRSTVELGVSGRLDFVDGMMFPSICDVIRNLSGMWQIMFPDIYIKYFDVPQNFVDEIGGNFYVNELQEVREGLEKVAGREITDDDLRRSIAVYNENRTLVRQLYDLRAARPWSVPASEAYLMVRAGMTLPVEEHSEQPPLNLIKSLELAGCYVVDDDCILVTRWLLEDVPTEGDPLRNLADAFLHHSAATAAKYEPDEKEKGQFLVRSVKRTGAEGVIFASPSFCDPALLDRPMMQHILKDNNIPYIAFKFAENSGQMQPIREQAGTFADSIKLWSE